MSLILKPKAASQDAVANALREFVEAASNSPEAFTMEALQEMVRMEVLEEAGGFLSYFKRYFTGVDRDVADEIRMDIAKIRTERDRVELLRFVDKLITEVSKFNSRGALNDGVRTGLAAFFTMSSIKGLVTTSKKKDEILSAINSGGIDPDTLNAYGGADRLAGKIQKMSSAQNIVGGVVGIYAAARLVANIFKIINKNNGTVQDYMDSLVQVRAEIAAVVIS